MLVGPPGAGKTTVGELVAAALGTSFSDTDADVAAAAGKSVAEIFYDDGEAAFRARERDAVAARLADAEGVLALGGGAVLAEQTRAALAAAAAPVVYLSVGLADAARRVGLARDRPVLAMNPRAQLHRLMAEREPLYAAVASARVDTDGRTPGEVADAVLAVLAGAASS